MCFRCDWVTDLVTLLVYSEAGVFKIKVIEHKGNRNVSVVIVGDEHQELITCVYILY